jgi:hypothetical protein
MVTMETTEHPLSHLLPPLTAHDRCDHRGCSAQAYVAVQMRLTDKTTLLFCGHHFRDVQEAIMAQNPFAIRDDIAVLYAPAPGVVAAETAK